MTPEILHNLLKLYGKTQEQFARDLDVSNNTVHRWITGKFNPSHLAKKRIQEVLERYETEAQDANRRKEAM